MHIHKYTYIYIWLEFIITPFAPLNVICWMWICIALALPSP